MCNLTLEIETVWTIIVSVGWYLIAIAISFWYASPYIWAKYIKWKLKKDDQDYAAKYHKSKTMKSTLMYLDRFVVSLSFYDVCIKILARSFIFRFRFIARENIGFGSFQAKHARRVLPEMYACTRSGSRSRSKLLAINSKVSHRNGSVKIFLFHARKEEREHPG